MKAMPIVHATMDKIIIILIIAQNNFMAFLRRFDMYLCKP